jgi:hypothetical protein
MSHGIARNILPINDDGIVHSESHHQIRDWICSRRASEENQQSQEDSLVASTTAAMTCSSSTSTDGGASPTAGGASPTIRNPSDTDILSGRGADIEQSPGNLWFRKWIETNCAQFEQTNKFERHIVVRSLYRCIQEKGGRFIKQVDNTPHDASSSVEWHEIDENAALSKIANTFRNFQARGHVWGQRGRKPRQAKVQLSSNLSSTNDDIGSDRFYDVSAAQASVISCGLPIFD